MSKTTRQLLNETAGYYTRILMAMAGIANDDVDAGFTRADVEAAHAVSKRLEKQGRKFIDPSWTPADEFQALGRLLREEDNDED